MERNPADTPQLVQSGPEYDEAGLAYRLQMPAGPGPYPLAVLLHGRLGDEDVMWLFRRVVSRPWLVVAPRAIVPESPRGFSWHAQPHGQWPELSVFDPAVDALLRFLTAMPRLYNADPDRTVLMGFSQGAAVAYATALRQPSVCRGIAGLVGFVPHVAPEAVAGRLTRLPVFMAVGEQDETVPPDESRRAAAVLRAAGAALDYRAYPTGHKLTAAALDDLQTWLASFP